MAAIDYDIANDPIPVDKFKPFTRQDGAPCICLPSDLKVEFVGEEWAVEAMRVELLDSPLIGVDSEWRPQLCKFDRMRPALFQISNKRVAYLIDLITLANNDVLDKALAQIFRSDKSTILGYSFRADLDVFSRYLPNMIFYRQFKWFLDAQSLYGRVCEQRSQIGLSKVAKDVLKMDMCKGEQMSNWELRPLRLTQ